MRVRTLVMMWVMLGLALAARAQAPAADEHVLKKVLVIEGIGGGGRTLLQTDAVEAVRVKGEWRTPAAGDEVTVGDGEKKKWEEREAAEDGWVRVRNGGYALWTVESPAEQVMVLEASGHAMAFVNGEPRMGDPYELGYVKLPVLLKAGVNEILLKSSRGRVRGKLMTPPADLFLNTSDMTMPDLLVDSPETPFGAVIVVNATREPLVGAALEAWEDDKVATTQIPTIPALSTRKVQIHLIAPGVTDTGENQFRFIILPASSSKFRADNATTIKVSVRCSTDKHKRTFISDIDGSVQYYSVVPPPEGTDLSQPKALILSLHGASVEATNQANCYKQRDWCYVVCPTNRRPYGFDWEDWGRLDAMEVLDKAHRAFKLDYRRTYLTGHSMGGHGTWNIGVQFPGTFAALGPSAGWISFASYTGRGDRTGDSPVEQILKRAACTSDTLAMKQNFASQGIYILHGDADDNVPVDQARTMKEVLGGFHKDFLYHEQPGAGHWWGDQCVDWDPMIDFFQKHALPYITGPRTVDFTTVNPGVSALGQGVLILRQVRRFEPSRVQLQFDAEKRQFDIRTENIASFSLQNFDGIGGPAPYVVNIDGEQLEYTHRQQTKGGMQPDKFVRDNGKWSLTERSYVQWRGLFKTAFSNGVVLVYGTQGSEEENAAALAKARYDAEAFWYRGNGDLRIMSDVEYVKEPVIDKSKLEQLESGALPGIHRNIVLYGNADTNAAWSLTLGNRGPISIRRGSIMVGQRELKGDNLACVFLSRMRTDRDALVGVVGGTGLAGMRLTDRLPYFVSGVGVPDWVVMSPDLLNKGVAGIKGAGFFGNDWTVENGEAAWQE